MNTYYCLIRIEPDQIGAYIESPSIAEAFDSAALKYKAKFPRLHVEVIAAQKMSPEASRAIL
jgi:hypothetical protein